MQRARRVRETVMIELLVQRGVVWAGWYRPENLYAKFHEGSPFTTAPYTRDPRSTWPR